MQLTAGLQLRADQPSFDVRIRSSFESEQLVSQIISGQHEKVVVRYSYHYMIAGIRLQFVIEAQLYLELEPFDDIPIPEGGSEAFDQNKAFLSDQLGGYRLLSSFSW